MLIGDSITQQSGNQEKGFALAPALQEGKHLWSQDVALPSDML